MNCALLYFQGLDQDRQDSGTGRDMLVARILGTVTIGDASPVGDGQEVAFAFRSLGPSAQGALTVHQPIGTPAGSEGFEIPDKGAFESIPHDKLSAAAEDYYRACIGPSGSGIQFGEGAKNVTMRGNVVLGVVHKMYFIELPSEPEHPLAGSSGIAVSAIR